MKLLACLLATLSVAFAQFNGAYWSGWGETGFQRVDVPAGAVGWSVVTHRWYEPWMQYIAFAEGGNSPEWDWDVWVWQLREWSSPSVRVSRVPRPDLSTGAIEWRFVQYSHPPKTGTWWVGVSSPGPFGVAWDLSFAGHIYRGVGWGGNINLYTGGGWDGGRLLVEPITETPREWGPR